MNRSESIAAISAAIAKAQAEVENASKNSGCLGMSICQMARKRLFRQRHYR